MKPKFWKLSQGKDYFTQQEILKSIENRLVYIHADTKAKGISNKTQAENFIEVPIGDYFYLTHGNNGIYLIGQFSGPANIISSYGDGWIDRPFRFILPSNEISYYNGEHKWWTPDDNSTFTLVPDNELLLFEEYILKPYFEKNFSDFGINILK